MRFLAQTRSRRWGKSVRCSRGLSRTSVQPNISWSFIGRFDSVERLFHLSHRHRESSIPWRVALFFRPPSYSLTVTLRRIHKRSLLTHLQRARVPQRRTTFRRRRGIVQPSVLRLTGTTRESRATSFRRSPSSSIAFGVWAASSLELIETPAITVLEVTLEPNVALIFPLTAIRHY